MKNDVLILNNEFVPRVLAWVNAYQLSKFCSIINLDDLLESTDDGTGILKSVIWKFHFIWKNLLCIVLQNDFHNIPLDASSMDFSVELDQGSGGVPLFGFAAQQWSLNLIKQSIHIINLESSRAANNMVQYIG